MTILTVDSREKGLEELAHLAAAAAPDAQILRFSSSLSALAEARSREIDAAFLRVDTPELSGLDLGQYLKELYPMINLIYVSDDHQDGARALMQHASGYLISPLTLQAVQNEMEDLRHPEAETKRKRVFAQTFGNFDFFVDGKSVAFKYSKTKEIVALLVNNRGAQTTNGEIIAALWEDEGDPEKKGSYLSNLRQDLQNTMTRLKLNGIIVKQRGSMAIAANKIECDLYDWLEKKENSKYKYLGDYMNQYSWGEYLHAELDEISYAMEDDEDDDW